LRPAKPDQMNFIPSNRDEMRQLVISEALAMFLKEGYIAVRMDDIAQKLQISKRTLYEMFGNKEQLLVECMQQHAEYMNGRIENEIKEQGDVLAVILKYLELIIAESGNANRIMFDNLDKYPLFKARFEEHMRTVAHKMRAYMDLGVKQGVFRDDLNMTVVMKSFAALGHMVRVENQKEDCDYEQLVNSSIVLLLRGIVTPFGMLKMEKYRYKHNIR